MKERIKELCRLNGISMNKLEDILGFGKGYISKLGESTPNAAKIKKIADYFNVSVDYLMTGKEKEGGETYYLNDETREIAQEIFENPDLRSLFDMSRKMTPERLKAHINFMQDLYNQEKGTDI